MRAATKRIIIIGDDRSCEVLVVGEEGIASLISTMRILLRARLLDVMFEELTHGYGIDDTIGIGFSVTEGVMVVHSKLASEFEDLSWLTGWVGSRFLAIGEWP